MDNFFENYTFSYPNDKQLLEEFKNECKTTDNIINAVNLYVPFIFTANKLRGTYLKHKNIFKEINFLKLDENNTIICYSIKNNNPFTYEKIIYNNDYKLDNKLFIMNNDKIITTKLISNFNNILKETKTHCYFASKDIIILPISFFINYIRNQLILKYPRLGFFRIWTSKKKADSRSKYRFTYNEAENEFESTGEAFSSKDVHTGNVQYDIPNIPRPRPRPRPLPPPPAQPLPAVPVPALAAVSAPANMEMLNSTYDTVSNSAMTNPIYAAAGSGTAASAAAGADDFGDNPYGNNFGFGGGARKKKYRKKKSSKKKKPTKTKSSKKKKPTKPKSSKKKKKTTKKSNKKLK